jgi:hypothetical protein
MKKQTEIVPNSIYDRDVLAWSERQAELLRGVARGELPNDVDWPHIIEEIEDVGLAELHACRSLLMQGITHLLKIRGWPAGPVSHWRSEAIGFFGEATQRHTPSMRQRIDLPKQYRLALDRVLALTVNGDPPQILPAECPFEIEDLTAEVPDLDLLLEKLGAATPRRPARPPTRRGA